MEKNILIKAGNPLPFLKLDLKFKTFAVIIVSIFIKKCITITNSIAPFQVPGNK